jgi:hypothetical protein
MKEKTAFRMGISERARQLALGLARKPGAMAAARLAAYFAGGFVLAGAKLWDRPLPCALALAAAPAFGPGSVCAYLGAALGYRVFWGAAGAFEPVAAGFAILAAACLVKGLLPAGRRWFFPALAAGLYALVGLIFLLKEGLGPEQTAFFAARVLLLGGLCGLFSQALADRSPAGRAALAVSLLAGTASIPFFAGVPLAAVLGAGAVFLALPGERALLTAAVCGLALDLSWRPATPMTAAFCLAALVCGRARIAQKPLRAAAFFFCCFAAVLYQGAADTGFPLAVLAGEALSLLVPESLAAPLAGEAREPDARVNDSLDRAAALLDGVSRSLDRARRRELGPESAAVFDRAADQVCRSCGSWDLCWDKCAGETYRALSGAAGRIFARGEALEEDLPESFTARCIRTAGFLTAVNEELERQKLRRQFQSRLGETRAVVADQYRFLARLLQTLAQRGPDDAPEPAAFSPDFGFRARGLRGGAISGDRGSCFTVGEWYYVLLCDGMGTGEAAGSESAAAVELLSGLIRAGFDAQDALRMLNGLDILQDGGYTTVDLLQASLVTGEGFLHKWGAAPSYLKTARRVTVLGTAAPPPGLERARRPECLRVSLAEGEMLALVSDGAAGEAAEQAVRAYGGLSPRELAAAILAGGAAADDRTAAVVRLRPIPRRGRENACPRSR